MATHAEVIVLGLGAMGAATCLSLARRGVHVLGLDQFTIGHAHGSSHGESRVVRQAYFEHVDYVPLLKRAYALWEELGGVYVESGLLYGVPIASAIGDGIEAAAVAHGLALDHLDSFDGRAFSGEFRLPSGLRGLLEPRAGFAFAERGVRAMADVAIEAGARLLERRTIASWSAHANGVTVVAADGETFTAERLVVCGGAWSGRLLADLGLPLKLLRKTMYWFEADRRYAHAPCFFFEMPYGVFYGFPAADGVIKMAEHSGGDLISSPEELNGEAERGVEERLRRFIGDVLPGVSPRVVRRQNCMYTMTPDENFVLDAHPLFPRVTFAAGFSGHGFKFAPVIGEVMADLSVDGFTRHPVEFLRLGRFGL